MKAIDVARFLDGVVSQLYWWNAESKYHPESVWKEATDGSGQDELLRPALTCDSFSTWLLAQGIGFVQRLNYSSNFDSSVNQRSVSLNYAKALILSGGGAALRPQIGIHVSKVDLALVQGLLQAGKPTRKGESLALWENVKGSGDCLEVADAQNREKLLLRKWWEPASWTHKRNSIFYRIIQRGGHGRLGARFLCTDRISSAYDGVPGAAGFDLVQKSLWRYFYLGKDKYAMALDWDINMTAGYLPFRLSDGQGNFNLPDGTPRLPFGEASLPNPCGSACPW